MWTSPFPHILEPKGSRLLTSLCDDIEAEIKALLSCATIIDLNIAVDALWIGAGANVDADAEVSIVACFVAIINLLVKVCVQVSAKFAVAIIFAKLDVVLNLCLVNFNICIGGIVTLIAKALADVTIGLLAQLHLEACLSILTLAGVGL